MISKKSDFGISISSALSIIDNDGDISFFNVKYGSVSEFEELMNSNAQIINVINEHTLIFGKEEIYFKDETDLGKIIISLFAKQSLNG